MKLPAQIELPFGYRIAVREVGEKELRDAAECEAGDDTPDGCWDSETRTIYVDRSLPRRRSRYILAHEFGHAFLDWQHFCLDFGAMKP